MKPPHPPPPPPADRSTSLPLEPHAPGSGKSGDASTTGENRWWLRVLLAVVLIAGAVLAVTHWGWHSIHDGLMQLNPLLTIVFICLLPVFGFSVAATYILAGARFGLVGGGAVIALATAVHLLASHFVCRTFVRGRMERFLARHRHRLPDIPPGENATLAAMVALVPGPPYAVRNYALALSDVPLRVYFWICLPIYVVRSYVTLALGDIGSELTVRKVALLGGILAVKLSICFLLLARLRKRVRGLRRADAPAPP